MLFSCHSLFVSLIFKPASDPKMVEENLPPLQSHHLLMYGPAIMVEFGRCDGDCCCSITQSCLTLCDPMDCSTLGLPVHHQLLELAQTHVHWVGDAIQPSHPLSSPSPPAFNLSSHWRRKWQPIPVFLPGESQRQGSLVSCRLWGRTESDTTEVT